MTSTSSQTWEVLASSLAAIAKQIEQARQAEAAGQGSRPVALEPASWRERLWTCPGETRLSVAQVAEATGLSKHAVYRLTSPKALEKTDTPPLPHRKLEGRLVFVASEVRDWLRAAEVRAG